MHTLQRQQKLASPIHEVFKFFQSPENLAHITPPSLNFRILTPPPIEMKQGALIDYTIEWLGFPVRWTTIISDFKPPHKFIDQQIRGPYSMWHHTHTFVECEGGTEMTDEVHYVLPFGVLGNLAHSLIVKKQLDEIFSYRASVISEFLPSHHSQSEYSLIKESAL